MKHIQLALLLLASAGCQSQRETYQENIHQQEIDRVIVETLHQRNFRLWQNNQKRFVGMSSFKSTTPCPAALGHMTYK